jgi:hypothetical protein
MGLFDKRDKKRGKDDFDSPVEQVDLGAVPSAVPASASGPVRAPEPAVARAPDPAPAPKPAEPSIQIKPEPAPKAPAPRMPEPETDDYGIDKAIQLMRTLPAENVELVVQVVKFSLESVGIKLPIIIEDAIRRQRDIQGRIGVLRAEIADLESEIKQRKDEIDRLDADHKETTMVRERLELAEAIGKPGAKPAAAAAAAPAAASDSGTASGSIPRVTKQTTPPPMTAASPSTSGLPPPGAPLKK